MANANFTDNTVNVTSSMQPIWTSWVIIEVPSNDNIPAGRAVRVGSGMIKRDAWEVARTECEKRPDGIGMAVRLDNERF